MSVFSKIVVLWHDAPLPLRRWLVSSPLAPSRRKLVNRVRLNQLEIFELRDPLPGHRLRMHWQTQKAFVFGTYEREVTRAIQRTVQPGWTVVDIGAHIGYHTLLLVKLVGPQGRVFAFEPMAENFQVLQENVALNGYENVVLLRKAVMDRSCRVTMARNNDDPLPSTAVIAPETGDEVEAVSLHQFFAHWPNRLAFIKMDVEGAEASILEGMERILKTDRPLLLIEVYGFDIHGMNHPALACLREAGYSFSLLDTSAVQVHIPAGPEA